MTRLRRALIDGVTLEYEDAGEGEPVVCIHGAFVADTFRPLRAQRGLADRHRLITYHRRGYAGSSRAQGPVSLADQAADCRGLLSHLGVGRAHVVGHSLGGAVALRIARDAPDLVRTLGLLEPALMIGESAPAYRRGLARSARRHREAGPRVALEEFMRMRWPEYRESLDRVLPGALDQAVADAATFFESEVPVIAGSAFAEDDARRITRPVLVMLGARSAALHPRFAETYRLLLEWLPDAEGLVLPGAAHFLQIEDPRGVADALTSFWTRHPSGA